MKGKGPEWPQWARLRQMAVSRPAAEVAEMQGPRQPTRGWGDPRSQEKEKEERDLDGESEDRSQHRAGRRSLEGKGLGCAGVESTPRKCEEQ